MKNKTAKPDAFTGSERHSLNGLKLEPWTEARRVASQTLGLVYPDLSAADWSSIKRGGSYPGAMRDVMLTLWLCTIPANEVLKVEIAGIENAMSESMAFGIKHGLHDNKKQPFWDALSKCMDIWHEINESVTVPAKTAEHDEESGND